MPEEIIQRHIRVVCDVREIIPHIRAGIYGVVAGLFNGGVDIRGIIVHLDLHHVAFHLELDLDFFAVQLIKPRRLYLLYIVAAQRDRVRGGNASGIRCHSVHYAASVGISDLEHRTLEQAAFRLVRDRIVLRGLLDHLDLAEDRSVLHDKLGRLAAPDAQRSYRIIQHIAFRGSDLLYLDLDFALAVCQQVIQLDVAVLVSRILADQIVILVLDEEPHTVNTLAGHCIDLFDAHAGELFVFKRHCCQLSGLDNHVLRGGVQAVALGTGDLGHDIDAVLQSGHSCKAGGVRGVSAHHFAVCLFHRKCAAVQRLVCTLDDLANLQAVGLFVCERQFIITARLDFYGLGHVLQDVPIRRLDLSHNQRAVREPRQSNDAVFIGLCTVLYDLAVCLGNGKNGIFERLTGVLIDFLDRKPGLFGIGERHLVGLAFPQFHSLGCFIDHIAIRCLDLGNDVSTGFQFGQMDQAVGVCHRVFTNDRSVPTSDLECCTLQSLAGFAVHLGDQQARQAGVFKGQRIGLAQHDRDCARLAVQNVAGRRGNFGNHIVPGVQIFDIGGPVLSGRNVLPDHVAVRTLQAEHRICQRLARLGVDLPDQDARTPGVFDRDLGVLIRGVLDLQHLIVQNVFLERRLLLYLVGAGLGLL